MDSVQQMYATRNVDVDDFDLSVIRITVQEFYKEKKIVPTCSKLLPVIRKKINFPWCGEALHKVLQRINFKWRKYRSKLKILIERPDTVTWRSRYRYLTTIKCLRNEGKPVFY